MSTKVNINGTDTYWPLTEYQVSLVQNFMCTRTYFVEWSMKGRNARSIYVALCDLEMGGEIENVTLFSHKGRYTCVFNDHQLEGMAVTCHGVGLFEAWLRGVLPILPPFRYEHPYAHYCILHKGTKFEMPLN